MNTLNPDDEQLLTLIERYLAGEASAAEAESVRAWVATDPEAAAVLQDLRSIRQIAADRPPESNVEAAWSRAVDELELGLVRQLHQPRLIPPRMPSVERPLVSPRMAAAAAVVALLGGTLLWQAHQQSTLPAAPEWKEYATKNAQRMSIRLSDGTQVMLAPASRLRYTADYGDTHRDVHLKGEAYFVAEYDEKRRFRVHTRSGTAEDLGTAFIVRNYAEHIATDVVVTDGRVALGPLMLNARDLGRHSLAGESIVQHDVDVELYLAWTRGELAFDGTTLRDVVLALERWYDVEIEVSAEDAAARSLTARFRDESVAQVLERIGLTLGLRVEQNERSFVLSRNPS